MNCINEYISVLYIYIKCLSKKKNPILIPYLPMPISVSIAFSNRVQCKKGLDLLLSVAADLLNNQT